MTKQYTKSESLAAVAASVRLLASIRGTRMTASAINGRCGLELTDRQVSHLIKSEITSLSMLSGLSLVYIPANYEVPAEGRRRNVRSDRTSIRPGFAAAFLQVVS